MVLVVEVCNGGDETTGDTVLLVEIDGTLDSLVTKNVSVSKILCDDTAAWLLLLGDLVAITLTLACVVASIILVGTSGTGNLDLGGAKLSIIEQEGSLRSSLLLKGYGRILGRLPRGDFETGDLSTVRK